MSNEVTLLLVSIVRCPPKKVRCGRKAVRAFVAWLLLCVLSTALSCTPPVRQYALKNQRLTCVQANEYAFQALQSMGFAISAFDPAVVGHEGTIHGSRKERGVQNVTVTINCLSDGTANIDASQDSELLGRVELKRGFYFAFTGVAEQTAIREAAAREEAQRPLEQKKQKGLRVLLQPIAGQGAKLDFALDLAADGILPVRVTINNASARSYSLDPDDVVLVQPDGTRVHPLPIDQVVEHVAAAERAKSDGAAATPTDSAATTQCLRDRLLQTHAVSANQQLSGYLYFPLATYTKGRVTLEDQESEEAEGFVVEF
jgi:hypothetical protein